MQKTVSHRTLNFNEQVEALPFSLNHFVIVSPIWIEVLAILDLVENRRNLIDSIEGPKK